MENFWLSEELAIVRAPASLGVASIFLVTACSRLLVRLAPLFILIDTVDHTVAKVRLNFYLLVVASNRGCLFLFVVGSE